MILTWLSVIRIMAPWHLRWLYAMHNDCVTTGMQEEEHKEALKPAHVYGYIRALCMMLTLKSSCDSNSMHVLIIFSLLKIITAIDLHQVLNRYAVRFRMATLVEWKNNYFPPHSMHECVTNLCPYMSLTEESFFKNGNALFLYLFFSRPITTGFL